MAKIIAVANTKGGVGKSTTAIQLALGLSLGGARVWLVDGDRQQTSIAAVTVRSEAGLQSIAASAYAEGAQLRAQVTQQAANFDYVIIDVGGRDSTALRAALTVADLAVVPFLPRTFDVWALDDMQALLAETRAMHDIRVVAFLNAADSKGSDNRDAAEVVAQLEGVELLPVSVGDRKAFAHASGSGMHISEHRPRDEKACAEAEALQRAIIELIA